MKNIKLRKFIAISLCIVMSFTLLSGFTTYRGIGNIYYESSLEIFSGTKYKELIGEHAQNGIEHAYIVETDFKENDLVPLVFNGEVRGVYTVGNMISYAKEQGYTVVAAINGDIYDTSSGTPKGTVIHAGNIVTSGYQPDRVIMFDENNIASIKSVGLSYDAKGTIEYQVEETIYPGQDSQGQTDTNPSQDQPQDDGSDTNQENNPSDGDIQADPTEPNDTGDTPIVPVEPVSQDPQIVVKTVEAEANLKIDFFNVPHGAANGLHLFNRHYASSTKTTGRCAEVVIEAGDIQLGVNKTINGIVKKVYKDTNNTPIEQNTLVLSTVIGSKSYDVVSCLKEGTEIEISVTDTISNGLENAKEAIGFYYSIVENGRNVTSGTNINPRTAIGFKRDGTLMLTEIDGRQSTHSKGVNLPDLANMLIDMGLEYAVNLDGGGSSVMYVRKPGVDSIALCKTKPSENSERKVANAILLAYKDSNKNSNNNTLSNLHIYPEYSIMMPGSSVTFTTQGSDGYYEKKSISQSISYDVESRYGSIGRDGIFIAGEKTGKVSINASAGRASGTSEVFITEDIIFAPSVQKLVLDAGEVRDLNVSAKYGSEKVSVPVISNDSLFKWTCDENIGTIDEQGVFTAVSSSAKQGNIYVTYKNVTKTIPVQVGANVVIFNDTAEHWAKEPIGVLAGIGYLSGMGENLFEPDGQLTRAQFVTMLKKITPDSPSEIVENLPQYESEPLPQYESEPSPQYESEPSPQYEVEPLIPSEDQSIEDNIIDDGQLTMNFIDVNESDWFYEYVKWGYEKGITSGMGDGTFAPNSPITREQMAVMLCNYANATGFILPQKNEPTAFADSALISSWAFDYVRTVNCAGIINGFDTGEFSPQGLATRAQAAKVIYVFCELKGIL